MSGTEPALAPPGVQEVVMSSRSAPKVTGRHTSFLLYLGALLSSTGCRPCNPMDPHPGCDLTHPDYTSSERETLEILDARKSRDGSCSSATCGSNSPYINTFPFNGLNVSGCINADGYALDKESIAPGDDAGAC